MNKGEVESIVSAVLIIILIAALGFVTGVKVKERELYINCMNQNKKEGFSEQRAEQRCKIPTILEQHQFNGDKNVSKDSSN